MTGLDRGAPFNTGFSNVDASGQPVVLVSHQDRVNTHPAVRAYKQQTYALLGLEPGDRVLEAGCGAGDDARALARLVGPTGRVVGVDASEAMVAQARARSDDPGLPVEFLVGDLHRLEFPADAFAAARVDRVLHHVEDPSRALGELARVVRPGGRVVAFEPDFDAYVVDHPDLELTRRFLTQLATDAARHGGLGRRLPALFRDHGLVELQVIPVTVMLTELGLANDIMWIRPTLERAQAAGTMSAGEAGAWLEGLEAADRSGRFFAAAFGFTVSGRKPA